MNVDHIRQLARDEFAAEQQKIAVAAEVARLRTRSNRSIWQRFTAWLPFIITRKKS